MSSASLRHTDLNDYLAQRQWAVALVVRTQIEQKCDLPTNYISPFSVDEPVLLFTQIYSMTGRAGDTGSLRMFAMILPSMISTGILLGPLVLVTQGLHVLITIEEHGRRAALIALQPPHKQVTSAEQFQMLSAMESSSRMLIKMVEQQQEMAQQIHTLTTRLDTLHAEVATGVRATETIAQSSKAMATMLYQQRAKPN